MQRLKLLMTNLDFFAEGVNLKINKMDTAKTPIGGFLALILFSLVGSLLLKNSLDLLDHKTPSVTLETVALTSPNVIFSSLSTPISFGVFYSTNKQANYDGILQFQAEFYEFDSINSTIKTTNHELRPCRIEDFPVVSVDVFKFSRMDQFLCIKNQNFTFTGDLTQKQGQMFRLRINLCKNTTSENFCKTEQQQSDFFLTGLDILAGVAIGVPSYNVQKYKEFEEYNIIFGKRYLSSDSCKVISVYLSTIEMQSNNGFITDDVITNYTTNLDYIEYDNSMFKEDRVIMDIQFWGLPKKYVYHRSYQKIQNIIAYIGGLMKVLVFVLKNLVSRFGKFYLEETILNQIFSYDLSENTKQNFKLRKVKNKEIKILGKQTNASIDNSIKHIYNNYFNADHRTSEERKLIEQIPDYLTKVKRSRLHFTYFNIFITSFCPCWKESKLEKKKKLYRKTNYKIHEILDVSHLIKKMEEVDIIKFIMFNDEQTAVFHLFSKHLISNERDDFHILKNYNKIVGDDEFLKKTIIEFTNRHLLCKSFSDFRSCVDRRLFEIMSINLKRSMK
jgi:hypothetical protein